MHDNLRAGSQTEPYQPSLGLGVLLTGDLVRTADLLPGEPTEDCALFEAHGPQHEGPPQPQGDVALGEGRRSFARYRLSANYICVRILGSDQRRRPGNREPSLAPRTSRIGRMTNASVTGLFVRCSHPLAFRSDVQVDLHANEDIKLSFLGRVVRTTADGMAIHLTTHDADWRFRASFIDLCRTPTTTPPTVTVRCLRAAEARRLAADAEIDRRIGEKWTAVEDDLANDALHQAFIQHCLQARRLRFAFDRYRELQMWPIAGFDPTSYLQQIGLILSFYQLQPTLSAADLQVARRYVPLAIATALVLFILVAIPYLIGSRLTAGS